MHSEGSTGAGVAVFGAASKAPLEKMAGKHAELEADYSPMASLMVNVVEHSTDAGPIDKDRRFP